MQKNKNPLVSIIAPNFNTISIVDSYIQNFQKIKYEPLEILVVDDCSTDGSYEKILEYSKEDKRIKLIQNENNSGPSKTRNNGIKHAQGKYIALLESDMEADPNYLNILISKLENNSELGAAQSLVLDLNKKDIIQCDGLYYEPHTFFVYSINVGVKKSDAKKDLIERYTGIGAVGSVIKKEVLDEIGGFDEKIVHNIDDIDLGWRIWLSGRKILFVPDAITYHVTYKKMGDREKVTPKVSSEFHFQKTLRIFIKNYEWFNILRFAPWLYLTFLVRGFVNLLRGNSAPLRGLWMSTKWLITNMKDNIEERGRVQSFKRFRDSYLLENIFMKSNYFQNLKKIKENLNRCEKIFK
jgi:GT2 family glycosyltransferase